MFKQCLVLATALASLTVFSTVNAQDGTVSTKDMNFKQTGPDSMEAVNAIEVEAKVLSVDKKKRTVTLQTEDNEKVTLNVGKEVRNFDQIKKNDILRVGYINSLAWKIQKNSDAPITITEDSDIQRAAPGQKPGGVITSKITARGVVKKIDKKSQSVTVEGAYRTIVLQVPKPEVFNNIKVGDKIEATYTEAMAVSIESVKK